MSWVMLMAVLATMAAVMMFSAGPTPARAATVAERLEQCGPAARQRMGPWFVQAAVAYPPAEVTLIGLKDSRVLEVWARPQGGQFSHVLSYAILGASGGPGPKLRQGDRQVPEGLYGIELLNPNSRYHISLRIGYPNADDRRRAQAEGRTNLGGDIMIHGGSGSVGCLAMGDEASEDLFVLAADVGIRNVSVILAPTDFRWGQLPANYDGLPPWTPELYAQIKTAMEPFTNLSPSASAGASKASTGGSGQAGSSGRWTNLLFAALSLATAVAALLLRSRVKGQC